MNLLSLVFHLILCDSPLVQQWPLLCFPLALPLLVCLALPLWLSLISGSVLEHKGDKSVILAFVEATGKLYLNIFLS